MLAPFGYKVFYAKFYGHILEFPSIQRVMLKLCALPSELWQLFLSLSISLTLSLSIYFAYSTFPWTSYGRFLGEPIQAEISAHTGLGLAYDSLRTLSLGKFAPKQGLSATRLSVPARTPILSLCVLEKTYSHIYNVSNS